MVHLELDALAWSPQFPRTSKLTELPQAFMSVCKPSVSTEISPPSLRGYCA